MKMMSNWKHDLWDFFYSESIPKQIFLTSYGLDTEFLASELLHSLCQIQANRETADWYFEMGHTLSHCKVNVCVDYHQWGAGIRNPLFESLGGHVHPIRVSNGAQHAKLWLAEYENNVRIAIGSANLTRDAFCNQIQYIWMADLSKGKATKKGEDNIKQLQSFLKCLQISQAVVDHVDAFECTIEKWCSLLDTVQWPEQIMLVPCKPKSTIDSCAKNEIEATGLDLVKKILPNKKYYVDIQVFSTGELNENFIKTIQSSFKTSSLNLIWPAHLPNSFPPSRWQDMAISESSLSAWLDSGCNVCSLIFNKDLIQDASSLLPHGKIYGGYQNKGQTNYDWLLLGSSNLSETAWTYNFELNVLIKADNLSLPVERSQAIQIPNKPWTSSNITNEQSNLSWLWAEETDNGVGLILHGLNALTPSKIEIKDVNGEAVFCQYDNSKVLYPGVRVNIRCLGSNARRIIVFFTDRPELVCDVIPKLKTALKRVSGNDKSVDDLQHEWILRRYGWNPSKRRTGSFRVDWVEEGMNLFGVIDRWTQAADLNKKDGQLLYESFKYFSSLESTLSDQKKVSFKIAAEEIEKWLTL